MKELLISNSNLPCYLDDDDYKVYSKWKWKLNNNGYVCRTKTLRNYPSKGITTYKLVLLHREINKTPKGFFTDHINGNKLDNRKENLTKITNRLNIIKAKLNKRNSTGFKNVSFDKSRNKYMVTLCVNGSLRNFGRFDKLEIAMKEANLLRQKYYV